jgi:3-dehydroquinate synthase
MSNEMKRSIQQKFSVPFNYQVFFTEGIFNEDNPLFADVISNEHHPKVFFVIDSGVNDAHPKLTQAIKKYASQHADKFTLCADPLIVPGGEEVKNDQVHFQKILDATSTFGIDRHSYIVAIGGGAVLDMAGFAAAIAHRGVRHIRIPTTVLAQNDAGIGVKNGINAYGKKNYLGAFAPPSAVINDSDFLITLDDRDWRSGITEAVKVSLIKDPVFFEWIEAHIEGLAAREMGPMENLIYRCAQLHLDHIAGGDPFESGSSRPLDFGHWSAHKLEHLTNYSLRHGEAVAIGIVLDSSYSYLQGLLSEESLHRIVHLLKASGFDLYVPELSGESLLKGLMEFREHLGGRLTIMLLKEIGYGIEVHEMDNNLILESVEMAKKFHEDAKSIRK